MCVCDAQDVSKHEVNEAETAKRKLWDAHAKRTALVSAADGRRSHVCDFVVTLHRYAAAANKDAVNNDAESTSSKVRGVGVHRLTSDAATMSRPRRGRILEAPFIRRQYFSVLIQSSY